MNGICLQRIWIGMVVVTLCANGAAHGFGFFGGSGLNDGARWDTEPRTINGGIERSLDGGLRFSVTGGSYQNFRDSFQWSGSPPSVEDFRQAIVDAFAAWQAVDPETGLASDLTFVEDFSVAVTLNSRTTGAEIDIIAVDRNTSGRSGYTFINWLGYDNLRLTSGARVRSQPISGADIEMNSNPGAQWNIERFRTILAHEIGHALGLRDVDVDAGANGEYVDDNFNGVTSATAAATLTNSFALLIDPMNPSASPLSLYTVPNSSFGFDSPGALIFMETAISSAFDNRLVPLTNDDFAGRQFLYPSVAPVPRPQRDFYTTLAGVPIEVSAMASGGQAVQLFGEQSTWSYLDDGSDQQAAWKSTDFDDSAWKIGPGKFGYGDGNEQTTILFGANANNAQNDSDQKFITTYFRRSFEASDLLSSGALELRLLFDDGTAVYLNGAEIERQNLPAVAGHLTTANSALSGSAETLFQSLLIAPTDLIHGTNTIAVEVHQAGADSSDLGFDMSLDLVPQSGGLLANDINPDGAPPLDAQLEIGALHGTVVVQSDGSFRYVPASGFAGEDRFTYSVPLPNGGRAQQTATVTVFAPDADSDGDGASDIAEEIAGTDPADPSDYLRITAFEAQANRVTVSWPGVIGRSYWVEYSTDLTEWLPVHASPIPTAGGTMQFEDTEPMRLALGDGFYRVRVSD